MNRPGYWPIDEATVGSLPPDRFHCQDKEHEEIRFVRVGMFRFGEFGRREGITPVY